MISAIHFEREVSIMDYKITMGNIVHSNTDAIVLPANTKLKEGSGTSRAIFEAAGKKKLTEACKSIGEAKLGTAVPTSGFDLNSKYIIHAVVPKWIDGEHDEYENLCAAYVAALNVADIMECESIAFPLLSAGNNGFDKALAFKIADECIRQFDGKNVREITLCVYDEKIAEILRSMGYEIEDNLGNDAGYVKNKNAFDDIKDAIDKGYRFIMDNNNQKKILELGKFVYGIVKEGKKIIREVKKR